MNLVHTPNANRLHIALFGKRNSGKSSLINALTGQDTALVSDTPGTTTDPVQKAMEIHGIGPCLFIDTPGFDDEGELGNRRIERTWKAVEKTDIALLLCAGGGSAEETGEPDFTEELHWLEQLKAKNIPTILLINKADIRKNTASLAIRFWKPADSCQCQREDRRRTDTTSHSGKVARRFRSAKHHRQSGNGRRSCLTGHATRYSSPQRETYFATSTDNTGIARQEMSDHELHHR